MKWLFWQNIASIEKYFRTCSSSSEYLIFFWYEGKSTSHKQALSNLVYGSHRVNTEEVLYDKNYAEIPILSYLKEILQSVNEEHCVVIILTSNSLGRTSRLHQ